MKRHLFFFILFLILIPTIARSQNRVIIDEDILYLRDTIGNNFILDKIIRGDKNTNAIWYQYDRRPNLDPWVDGPTKNKSKYTEENFIQFFKEIDIKIIGAINTYDDCGCTKTRSMGSPDMTLINFKILKSEFEKLIEFYPKLIDSKIISESTNH